MSERHLLTVLDSTPAFVFNNLSYSGNKLCFTGSTRHGICCIDDKLKPEIINTSTKIAIKEGHSVVVQKAINILGSEYLVIGTANCLQIWTADSPKMVYSYPFPSGEPIHCQAITAVPKSNMVCCAFSNGRMLVLSQSKGYFEPMEPIVTKVPIMALDATATSVVCAHDDGSVVIRDADSLKVEHTFLAEGLCCSSLICKRDCIIVGFTNGSIRIYSIATLKLKVDIAAHSKTVTGMALSPDQNKFASVSEDAVMTLWELGDMESREPVKHCFSDYVKDHLFTGVQITDTGFIVAVAYDLFSMPFWKI